MESQTPAPPLLEVQNLKKHFPVERSFMTDSGAVLRAVDGVTFNLNEGEALGLVGESGCGKSTVARAALRLVEPTSGNVRYRGRDLARLSHSEMRALRKEMQIIFQDPFASLNPKRKVGKILEEPFDIHGSETPQKKNERVDWLLERVGLSTDQKDRYPHEFSGGQLQRIGIARAIALQPKLIVADEPVSALDVSIQAQVLNLLLDLREGMGISFLFISHDMAVVKYFCDRVAVMYLGKIVEFADSERLYESPRHPYTEALLAAIPNMDPNTKSRSLIKGDIPSAANPPPGCAFQTRCPIKEKRCEESVPELKEIETGRFVACFLRES